MHLILIKIQSIEEHYVSVQDKHSQSFEKLYRLCNNEKCCKDFYPRALSVYRQDKDLEGHNFKGLLDQSEYHIKKRRICDLFERLLLEMKEYFDPKQTNSYEEQILLLREQQNILIENLMKIEDRISEGGNTVKQSLLEIIQKRLRKMRECLLDLMEIFQAVREYE